MTTKRRLCASVDAELVAVAQEAVTGGHAGSINAWGNDALRLKADHDRRLQALDDFLAAYEAAHGGITDQEMPAPAPPPPPPPPPAPAPPHPTPPRPTP